MSSNFPTSLDSDLELPAVNSNITEIGEEAINALRDAVFAIEAEIGVGASGSAGSISTRLGMSLEADGAIKPSAIAAMGLVTLPIYNSHIAANAEILESKLKLDHRTTDLYNNINDLASDINNALGWINVTGIKLTPHVAGALYRHELSHIDVSNSTSTYFKNKFNNLRDNTNAYTSLNDLNSELVNHQKLDGLSSNNLFVTTNNGSSLPAHYAHPASGIYLNTDRFTSIPQTAADIQQFAEFIDSSSIFLYGTRIQNFYSNGVSRASRSSSLLIDGYGQAIVEPTTVISYLLNGLSSTPVDNIDNGDDIIEFKPSGTILSSNRFDSQFNLVKVGDVLRINYGSIETSFVIKEKKYIQNGGSKSFYVRVNGRNLLATTSASARIDRPLYNNNKQGVLSVSAANNEFGGMPSLIVNHPRAASALGIGFNPNLFDNKHYLLYLVLYPNGNPLDGYLTLPGIDVTGNLGTTPGKYTLNSIVESTNNALRKKGYNYRFNAFQHKGEFGISLSDPYNNASFSIANGVVAGTGLFDQTATNIAFSNNVVGLFGVSSKQAPDPLGFGTTGSAVASPLPQTTYLTPDQAVKSTKVFSPLKRNTYYVNGTEKDRLQLDVGQVLDNYGDGYWVGTIEDRTEPSLARVATKFRITENLTTSKLKAGKTIVVQGIDSSTSNIINFGRYIIESVSYDECPDPVTDIVIYDAVHGKAVTPFSTFAIGTKVRLYFTTDSISFNQENSTDETTLSSVFKRNFEVFIDSNGETITHERARLIASGSTLTVNGVPLYASSNLYDFSIIKVSPKLRGYNFFSGSSSVNKITLNIANFNSTSGVYDGYLAFYDGSSLSRLGPTTTGRIGQTVRFYDETNIDYIDFIYEFNSAGTFSNQLMDIQLFPTLTLDKELFFLATCQLNEPGNKKISYIRDERQFGNISEEELSTSALDYISSGDRLLHGNGVIRGFDITNDVGNPINEQIRLSGGMALVNGSLVQINSTTTSIPIIRERHATLPSEYYVNWAVCVNDKSELQAIPLLDYDSNLGTHPTVNRKFLARNPLTGLTYNIEAVTFSNLINYRKDLCVLYVVASTVTGSSGSTAVSLSVTDSRKFVNDEGSNLPLKYTSEKSQGNFKSPVAILNWVKLNNEFNSHAIFKGANSTISTPLTLSFTNTVYLDGENSGNLTFEAAVSIGSNLIAKDLSLTFNQGFSILSAASNLTFDHCNLTIDNVAAGTDIFSISNASNVTFKDCTIKIRYTTSPSGNVFNILNSSNINFINTSVSGISTSPIFPGTSSQDGNMFVIDNSPNVTITNCSFTGNFAKLLNLTNTSLLTFKNNIVTTTHVATSDSGWSATDFVNSSSGLIYSNISATTISDIIIDGCTFNFSPASASSNRFPTISFELSSITSSLKNLVIKDCKFNNTNTGADIFGGYVDDKRPAISIVNIATAGSSTTSQPLLLNADIVNNYCNRNQSIILTSKTDSSGIMTYPGLTTVNCNVSGNICGTIGYWVSAGTRVNNAPTATDLNAKGSGLIIYNNDCHYVTNLTSTGKFYQASKAPLSIQNVSNSSGLIQITTFSAHNLGSGANVVISGVIGVTAANGSWVVTVTSSTSFTLNGSVFSGTYTLGGQIDQLNLCNYPSGHVVISHNRLNWIHTAISFEENSALTISKNILNAFDTNYVAAYEHTSSSNSGSTYGYAISIGTNYYQSSSSLPGISNDTNVIIEGNITNTGYYIDSNSLAVSYNYFGYVNSIGSSTIINNTFKGIDSASMVSPGFALSLGGSSNIVTDNRIYRQSKVITAYVTFANYILATSSSYGNITNNYFDKSTTDDSVNENLAINLPDRWTYEKNKNQSGFMTIGITNGGFSQSSTVSATYGSAFLSQINQNKFVTLAPDDTPEGGSYRSNVLRIYDLPLTGNTTAEVTAFGWQQNISNLLPNNVRVIQIFSGIRPINSTNLTTGGGAPVSMFRLYLNKYKTGSTFAGSYTASNGVNSPPITKLQDLQGMSGMINDTYGIENLRTNAIYHEVTGAQINAGQSTYPIYINLENVVISTTQSASVLGGVTPTSATGNQTDNYITGKGYDFSVSMAFYWKRANNTASCELAVAPVVVKYRW